MNSIYLKAKIHGAKITGKKLHYDGSIEVDMDILDKAGIGAYQQVQVLNFNTGARFITYTLPGKRGSKTFALAGPAARKGEIGDRIIVIAYAQMTEEEARNHKPTIVMMDDDNNIKESK
ncbi:MAG: aspartate 1-decarboxylase [Candidatus Zixiibacteriota bacterium]